MRKRIGIYGATEEALHLIPLLEENPEVEIGAICDADAAALRERLPNLSPSIADTLRTRLTEDPDALRADPELYAIIDSAGDGDFARRYPEVAERGVQIVAPLTARLLWGYGSTSGDHKGELLQALHEIVESYNLTVDADEVFRRMLEIARSVTGADGGSVMLVDPEAGDLRVRVALGVEPELWPKIRVPIGEGIAGKVAQEARPVRLRGKADRTAFRIVRERLDVESALCVPLLHDGKVLGVLNLHHSTRPDAFTEDDLEFVQQLAHLDAQIIARSQEHESMRNQAARYAAVREVRSILALKRPIGQRMTRLCQLVARRAGRGIANLYLYDETEGDLRLAATSLEGGGFGGEYRIALGHGIDGSVAQTRTPTFLRSADGSLAFASLPLVSGGVLAAVLSVQAGPDAPGDGPIEVSLLEIAAAAADGIANAERETRISARATKVGAINETGIRMVSTTDPAEVLRLGTSSVAMVLEADHAVLRLQDEETGRYVIRSYFGSADGQLQKQLFELDKRVAVETIKRRRPRLVRNVSEDPVLQKLDGTVQSILAAPLMRDGRVIGALAVYDKVAADFFHAGSFSDDDLQLFSEFVSYLERAIANALFFAHARQNRSLDEETGLPNERYIERRIREEIARAGGRENSLALAVCRIENLEEIERVADPVLTQRIVKRTVDAFKRELRDFDVVGRTGYAEFTAVLPEPGDAAGERIHSIARAVAEDVAKDDKLNEPLRIELAFGYAIHPTHGRDRESLVARARAPRIRMV
jgi:GAF domain-containing protein